MTRTGRCLCGDVSYELSGDPIATVVCHCDHCQRQSGGAFSLNMVAHESQLSIDGTLQTYVETGENDDGTYVNRKFCGTCGSPIVSELVATEGVVAVKVGTLDDRSDIAPAAEVWCVDKQPWVELASIQMSMDRE
ncbi:MAG: GFA family protein [Acidimicrobiales bacterium]|nr:GFA family protein [Acidimicrobiales bacterium]